MATYEEITYSILKDGSINEKLKSKDFSSEEAYDLIYEIVARFSHIKRHSKDVFLNLPKKYVSFDIETTGLTKTDKITQISAIKMENGKELDYFSSFVNIGDKEIPINIAYLTNISQDMLKDAPQIDTVISSFLEFMDDLPLIGHNVISFDIPFIRRETNVDLTSKLAIDTVSFAQESPIDIPNCKLETLKEYYGINNRGHDALEDARSTALIYENLKKKNYVPSSKEISYAPIFKGKKFVFTGKFKNLSRKQIETAISSRGGKIQKTVTENVDYFLVGVQVAKNLVDGIHSSKELTYMELKNTGKTIEKISEDDFLEMIGENKNE